MADSFSKWDVLNDPDRLAEIDRLDLLDTAREEAFDRLTRLASRILNAPVALVSIVSGDKQFFKSHVGLPERFDEKPETPLSMSFCKHVVAADAPLIVSDSEIDSTVMGNDAIDELGVRSYLGMPIRSSSGHVLGSFCVIDHSAREWTDEDRSLMSDLTKTVTNEIRLRELLRAQQESFERLQQVEMQRDEYVHMVAHDLKSPLSSILMFLDLLHEEADLQPVFEETLVSSRETARRMRRMIQDMLDIRKAESGQFELDIALFDANNLVTEVENIFRPVADQAGLALDVRLSETDAHIGGNRYHLERVLTNLVSNAIDHTPSGGTVTIFLDLDATSVVFGVKDTGVGIPKSEVNRIFEKYAVLEGARLRGHSTGLGLTYSKLIAERHGGTITVESKHGEGSIFRVTLPRRQAGIS